MMEKIEKNNEKKWRIEKKKQWPEIIIPGFGIRHTTVFTDDLVNFIHLDLH